MTPPPLLLRRYACSACSSRPEMLVRRVLTLALPLQKRSRALSRRSAASYCGSPKLYSSSSSSSSSTGSGSSGSSIGGSGRSGSFFSLSRHHRQSSLAVIAPRGARPSTTNTVTTSTSSCPPLPIAVCQKTFTRSKYTMAAQPSLKEALASNEAWATSTHSSQPTFFPESAKGQQPKILWLGCSDSRVPESTILNVAPGAVFTHRNIANIFTSGDLSSLSVIEYAVAAVGVQHVVVCGHTSCGGVAAALANRKIGVIDAWLAPLRAARARLLRAGKLGPDVSDADKSLALVEENVRDGVRTVRCNPNVLKAAKDRGLTVHGMVYDLACGRLRELTIDDDQDDMLAREEAHTTS